MTSRRSEEHTSELQSHSDLVCRLLLEKKKQQTRPGTIGERAAEERGGGRRSRPRSRWTRGRGLRPGVEGVAPRLPLILFFFFNDTATPEIFPLSLPAALPI